MHILLDAARPILQPFNHCSTIMILVTLGGSRAVCNSRWSRAKRSATLSTGLVASELHDGLIQFLLNCAGQREQSALDRGRHLAHITDCLPPLIEDTGVPGYLIPELLDLGLILI